MIHLQSLHKFVLLGGLSVALMACTPAYDPNLTPEQNRQMQRNAQYNRTLGEGALAGTALGALVGGLAGHGKGALIGSLSGAALGTGAGYLVANRTQNQQISEDQLNRQIAAAHQIAMTAQADAERATKEADQMQIQLVSLNRKIAAKKITVVQYRQAINRIKAQTRQVSRKIKYYSQKSQQFHQYAAYVHDGRFEQSAQQTDNAVARLKDAENILVSGVDSSSAAS